MSREKTHEPIPIRGYKPQSDATVTLVNGNKETEEKLLRFIDGLETDNTFKADRKWLNVARIHFEEGFMALNRSLMKPGRFPLAMDPEEKLHG